MANQIDSKWRFLKIYSDLPVGLRRETVLVVDGQPYSWNVIFQEVTTQTKLGVELLEALSRLEFI